ncbi:MAG: NUDIX domain-containing protein, partial [Gammaproteobacteria bacterium]
MKLRSAGILLYRFHGDELQVLLVHPGGPFWVNKEDGAWSLPKGLYDDTEEPLDAAKREFREETGYDIAGDFVDLGEIKQPSKKLIHAWAVEGGLDANQISSNTFSMEWPKG